MMDEMIQKGAEMIRNSGKILIFTGAGLSTESGIPDFRSPGGIWDRYDPSDFEFQKIISSERAREKYWKMSTEFYETMKDARPNPAHLAIADLESTGKLVAVVTQNIDNLHQKAGSTPEKVIEIHGSAFSVSCLECGQRYDRDVIEGRLAAGESVPKCDACSGILKPDTISFGQAMPQDLLEKAFAHAEVCDLCIVLGSSLVVYPAASVPLHVVDTGSKVMIINRDPTPLDPRAELVIHGSVGRVLPEMVASFRGDC
jgi:NAD-dependent deacetylase